MSLIESLLAVRTFTSPELAGDRLYFVSNLSGRMSLFVMDAGGSVPEPLLPPGTAMQNPALMGGRPFAVLPALNKILVLLDQDGDENYQPMWIPLDGGFPEPAFGGRFQGNRSYLGRVDTHRHIAYLMAESRSEALMRSYRIWLDTGRMELLGEGTYGPFVAGVNKQHTQAVMMEAYGNGDHYVYLFDEHGSQPLFGAPLTGRQPDETVPPNNIGGCHFVANDTAVLCTTSLFSDTYGLGHISFSQPGTVLPVAIRGLAHEGGGELDSFSHLAGDAFLLSYNIDGCSWLYEAEYDDQAREMRVVRVLAGRDRFAGGLIGSFSHDEKTGRIALTFTTATSPKQIYTVEGADRNVVRQHTRERVLGLSQERLAPGEDASFISHDGLRISARLYLPAAATGHQPPHPVVFYIHGGPQSQERPDFAWFSTPLIQALTMNGIAVFVPNVRGSTGYGFDYMKRVHRDWGGQDRLDHVFALTRALPNDSRLDCRRAGVVGRSYGGYMTLMLAARHPELWSAAVDMFGPFDLVPFARRQPATWKPFFTLMMGDPDRDAQFLTERSPRTYIHQLACPMLVIQGKNDPRVTEAESRDLVADLRAQNKEVEYLMFEDEGHDVLKYANRLRCYTAITDFFAAKLK